MNGKEFTAIVIVFTLTVLMPLSIGIVIRFVKGPRRESFPASDPTLHARIDRLEQSMDAIAVEIERISEGQRFVTKIMTERPAASLQQPERSAIRPSNTPH
jgi:hypothetical protein